MIRDHTVEKSRGRLHLQNTSGHLIPNSSGGSWGRGTGACAPPPTPIQDRDTLIERSL